MQGIKADLALSTVAINERQPMIALNRISKVLMGKSSVLIIGLVYKPRTEVLDKSQSLQLARELKQLGHSIFVFDPYISEFDKSYLESSFDFLTSLSREHIFDLAILSPGFEGYSKELGSKQKIYKFS
jgi:UDP-N-acetyl-D-mannosaminuronate dehydrogenase